MLAGCILLLVNAIGSRAQERSTIRDRLESAVSNVERVRNDQARAVRLILSGATPELFLAAGDVLTARADLQGLPVHLVEALRALAVAQGIAAKSRP